MLQYFKTQEDYLNIIGALADAFAAGMTFAQSGEAIYDENGDETKAYADAFAKATDITPVYPPEEYERMYQQQRRNIEMMTEILRDTEYAATEAELASLQKNMERERQNAKERWEQYLQQQKTGAK